MGLTNKLNSRANIKQYSNGDLPINPRQPVIAKYGPVESTASQTVINLPFSIDQASKEVFILMVDGKVLSEGSSYDFTFTSVDVLNQSSQVTLNYPLDAGLNIQALKLGLKKETEFLTDNRFTQLYEAEGEGFQGFVKSSAVLTATTATGTPAAGTFYSTIVGRKPLLDLSQDLKPRMGIDRIMTQQIHLIQDEFGPNGEQVFGVINDTFGQIRYVGNWSSAVTSQGQYVSAGIAGDYVEVTFYGTGLNLMHYFDATGRDYRVSVDGGSEGSNIYPSTGNGVISSRGYSGNVILPVVSGLTLGIHTIKIRMAVVAGNQLYGFEILNESSSVKTNPGISYISGKKVSLSAQSSIIYSNSVTGTRGGRVLHYLKSDGTIGQSFTPVNANQANLTSADHTNEEIARTYFPREFGAGRADDFSLVMGTSGNKAFVLDDGTTALYGADVGAFADSGGSEGIYLNSASSALYIMFVGTGLDVAQTRTGSLDGTITIAVDGTNIITATATGSVFNSGGKMTKIVSGLPYGTHIVKIAMASFGSTAPAFSRFTVYQPKKPTLPAGAVELAEYNVMADYVIQSSASSTEFISTGVLYKSSIREHLYVGSTWSVNYPNVPITAGGSVDTTNNGDYVEYTFFGTGFNARAFANAASISFTVAIDGSNYTGAGTVVATGTTSWTPGTSTWLVGTGNFSEVLSITGLSLGKHTVRFTRAGSAGALRFVGFAAITPIHSYKPNIYADFQNTLPIGSQGISDNRKLTPIKDAISAKKPWVQAVGIASNPSTTSTTAIPLPDMSVTIKTSGGDLEIYGELGYYTNNAAGNAGLTLYVYVDGVSVGPSWFTSSAGNGVGLSANRSLILPVSAGVHKVDLYWSIGNGATLTAAGVARLLKVREV